MSVLASKEEKMSCNILTLATVGAVAIPVLATQAIEGSGALNSDTSASYRDQRACPLFVPEGGGAREGDGGASLDLGQVESRACWNGDAIDSNICA